MNRLPLTDEEGEVRELTAGDMKLFRPIAEADPSMVEAMTAMRNKGGRPRVEHPREHIAFRWDQEIVARIKATGKNYNARVEKLLREAMARGDL